MFLQIGCHFLGVSPAAGCDRLPWLWYRCDTADQQIRISVLAGQSYLARPAGFEPATRCLEVAIRARAL
jgi:hypothetical protein